MGSGLRPGWKRNQDYLRIVIDLGLKKAWLKMIRGEGRF